MLFQSSEGKVSKPKIERQSDGTYLISFTPEDLGCYTVSVTFAGQELPCGPITVNSVATGNANMVKFTGEFTTL